MKVWLDSLPTVTCTCGESLGAFASCESPETMKRLEPGRHRFKVRAIDSVQNVDATPAKDRFRLVD